MGGRSEVMRKGSCVPVLAGEGERETRVSWDCCASEVRRTGAEPAACPTWWHLGLHPPPSKVGGSGEVFLWHRMSGGCVGWETAVCLWAVTPFPFPHKQVDLYKICGKCGKPRWIYMQKSYIKFLGRERPEEIGVVERVTFCKCKREKLQISIKRGKPFDGKKYLSIMCRGFILDYFCSAFSSKTK